MDRIGQGWILGRLDQKIGDLQDPGTPRYMIVSLLQQIESLISVFEAHPSGRDAPAPADGSLFRHEVINRLQVRHALVLLIVDDLVTHEDHEVYEVRKP